MKYIFLIFFMSFLSSSDMKKVYVYEDGIERHYLIYVPDAYNKDITPLLNSPTGSSDPEIIKTGIFLFILL